MRDRCGVRGPSTHKANRYDLEATTMFRASGFPVSASSFALPPENLRARVRSPGGWR